MNHGVATEPRARQVVPSVVAQRPSPGARSQARDADQTSKEPYAPSRLTPETVVQVAPPSVLSSSPFTHASQSWLGEPAAIAVTPPVVTEPGWNGASRLVTDETVVHNWPASSVCMSALVLLPAAA